MWTMYAVLALITVSLRFLHNYLVSRIRADRAQVDLPRHELFSASSNSSGVPNPIPTTQL